MKQITSASLFFVVMLLCQAAAAEQVKLYAAASLTDVLTELSNSYQKAHPNTTIKMSFAGSATLAKQIEQGAPADIFISADNDWINYLQARELLATNSQKKLLKNELVFIAPIGQSPHIIFDSTFKFSESFQGRLCTGDTTSVPVGKYAKQSLTYYQWWNSVAARVVGTEDVRTALAFVERAECNLGIVYKTDAQLSKKVNLVATIPAESHAAIEYSGALTKTASEDAKNLWTFLQSDQAKNTFLKYGFLPNN